MKKIRVSSFLLALLLSFSVLVSCDGGEPSDPPADEGNGESTVTPSYGENTVDYDALS